MENLKDTIVGMDIPIQAFQKYLYKKLKAIWPVGDADFESYGRVYKNANDKGYVPEIFVKSTEPDNTLYKPVFFDKTNQKALFFFIADDNTKIDGGQEIVRISLIFIVNVAKLKPELSHRGDEEIRADVFKLLDANIQNFLLVGYERGFRNVLKMFDGLVNKDGEVFEDRHPMFCFKFNLDLYYQPTLVPCNNKTI